MPDMFTPAPQASTTSQAAPSVSSPSSSSARAPPSSSAAARSSALPTTPAAPADLVDPATGRFNLNLAALPDSEPAAVAPEALPQPAAAGGKGAAAAAALQEGRNGLGSLSWIAVVLVAVLVGVGKLGSSHWA